MRTGWLVLLPFVAACAGNEAVESAADGAVIEQDQPDARPEDPQAARLPSCVGRTLQAPPDEDWQHFTSGAVVVAGDPRHYAQDVIAAQGETATVAAKFAYGAVWKDLEDERIQVLVDDCTGWRDAGVFSTDDDGEIHVALDGLTTGEHEVRLVVLGDGTQAVTSVWSLPRGTHVVVTDVDGTMTTADTELFQELLDGDYVPEAYPSAQALTHAHVGRGHVVVYLTGRPYWLLDMSRAWLGDQGFARGPVHVTDANADSLPTEGGVGDFKAAYLEALEDQGLVVDLAYGNATTDIYAYVNAGVGADRSWIIGAHAGEQGTHAVTDTWAARTAEVVASPLVSQPF